MRKKGGLGRGLAALIPSESVEAPGNDEPESQSASISPRDPINDVSRETSSGALRETVAQTAARIAATKPVAAKAPSAEDVTDDDDGLVPVPGAAFRLIPLDSIAVNPKQPRQYFDEEGIEELKVSLREVGLLQPIAVRPAAEDGTYELIMGERRTRAAREVGWDTIPAIIRQTQDDELLRDALLENIHRVQLNPLEEGAAYQQLLEEFGVTQEQLAKRIGRSRPQISNTIRLLNLPPAVQQRVASGVLSAGHARSLLALSSTAAQEALAKRIVAEGLSVRATEEIVKFDSSVNSAGDVSRETSKKSAAPPPGLDDLADRLSSRFDTTVKVALGQRKGKIVIEFGSVDDLERIAGTMGLDSSPS